MESYASNEVALDVACRLYFTDAFGFLRRVMLILVTTIFLVLCGWMLMYCCQEIAAPHHMPEGGEAVN
jgi:hypothetical protein